MYIKQIIAIICLVVGIYLVATARIAMSTTKERIQKELTGNYPVHTRNSMIGGVVLVLIGAGMLVFFRGKKS